MEVKSKSFFERLPELIITVCVVVVIIGLIVTEVFVLPEQRKVMKDYLSEQNIEKFEMRHIRNSKGEYVVKDEKTGNFYFFKINSKWQFQVGKVTKFEEVDKETVKKIINWD